MKRVLKSTAAVLMAAFLPAMGAVASSGNPLDYANSIGRVGESDTINRVVEATADGGYVVGGQMVVCERYNADDWGGVEGKIMGDDDELDDDSLSEPEPELVPAQECIDYYYSEGFSVAAFCSNSGSKLNGSTKAISDEYYYNISCANYVAKFKKDGTREWITPFDNGDKLLAVGETPTDYRLVTSEGVVLIVDKTGTEKQPIESEINDSASSAKIDRDGTIFVSYGYSGICKYGLDGEELACIPKEDEDVEYSSNEVNGYFLMNGEIFANYYDYDTGEAGIVKISKDLATVTPILKTIPDDSGFSYYVVSNDADGNLLAFKVIDDDPSAKMPDFSLISISPQGEIVAELDFNEDQERAIFDGVATVMPGFVIYNRETKELVRYDNNLEEAFSYQFEDDEMISSSATLDDGSVVVVGGSTTSNENYDVDGSMNGIQIRLDVSGSGDPEPVDVTDNVANPKTLDEMSAFVMIGGAIIAIAGVVARKMLVRR